MLADVEKAKYTKIWGFNEYRRVSPGELDCARAFELFAPNRGDSLIDYGSGPARATKWFADKGLRVKGVDIAANASETDVPIIEACLWDLPADLEPSDYAYCCDVMEHIPTSEVENVLDGIGKRTLRSAYFRIATHMDHMGPRLIGSPLHLTVRPVGWWMGKLETVFPHVAFIKGRKTPTFFARAQ